ncbi:MAG TPA: DUF1592 domain-containing protein, partial [Polyangia bacterium]|nr:DUF1592 domain-containing protein [Polyangia bacterium]
MRHSIRTSLVGFLLAGLVGCTGTVGGTGTGGTGTGTGNSTGTGTGNSTGTGTGNSTGTGTGNSTGTGTGGSAGTGTGGAAGTTPNPTITCAPGIPATTQLRRMMNWQYDATVRDLLGVTSVSNGTTSGPPSAMLYADFDGPMVPDAWRLYQDTAAAIAKAVMASTTQKANFISCDPAASGCLMTTITTFGRKAFRRPLTTDEVSRFVALGTGTPMGTPAEVAEATLLGFLVSPQFLMLPETGTTTDAATGAIQLSQYEIATRLSYMLWGSMPDATLSTAADMSQLGTKDQILAQAQRMIMDRTKTSTLISGFHDNWVQMNNAGQHWWKIDHDTSKFPLYNTTTSKTSFAQELDSFWSEVAYGNGGYQDLFLSTVGFVNKDNAQIYGLPATTSTTLTKTTLDANQRPGFMTRAGFLSSYSHYNETAPILRGAFVTVYMIGVDPGPPLAGATMLTAPAGNYATNRDKTDALVNMSATCMGCHTNIINPPGYVMETYDSIGKWQTTDQLGGAINGTATVNFGNGNTQTISSPLQLMQQLATIPKA